LDGGTLFVRKAASTTDRCENFVEIVPCDEIFLCGRGYAVDSAAFPLGDYRNS
jgi:hypothetical protein